MSGNEKITVIDKNAIQIKNIGASGLKILVYLRPQSNKSDEILRVVNQAIDDGRKENLPTFLGIISEDIENTERVFDCVEFFLKKAGALMKKEIKGVTPQAMQKLMLYPMLKDSLMQQYQ